MTLLTKAVLVLIGVVAGGQGEEVDVESHLRHLTADRYPSKEHESARNITGEYIASRLEEYGLWVEYQRVTASAHPDPTSRSNVYTPTSGMNVVGVMRQPWGKVGDVVVVGAGYDTNGVDDPRFYNGAGVAVLLETARLFASSVPEPSFTVLFVAFDLSIDNYKTPWSGYSGGWYFVQTYLEFLYNHNKTTFGGAIILGPVMNVNHEKDSQSFPDPLDKLFPDASKTLQEEGLKGDFLAMVTHSPDSSWAEVTHALTQQILESYKKTGGKVVELNLGDNSYRDLASTLPLRQTVNFWGSTIKGYRNPLPAILLTDTENLRARPPPTDGDTYLTDERRVFLSTTVKSLVEFLVNRHYLLKEWSWLVIAGWVTLGVSWTVNFLLVAGIVYLRFVPPYKVAAHTLARRQHHALTHINNLPELQWADDAHRRQYYVYTD